MRLLDTAVSSAYTRENKDGRCSIAASETRKDLYMKSLNELHIGFIGLGNMGGAVAEGFVRAGIPAGNIYACGGHFEKFTARCADISALAPSDAENAASMIHGDRKSVV